ncbi:diguanylate cyclase (GGDEF) domain-containing protein [Marinobacter daqiaonensis]|uniref:diguanylate cyclase n=1 Tax=Marinobacter daqiaonensis TaxID=650891 RepID=A0A1I6J4D6_9GAMM|nr:GGDEF domain-containing protein [Marinobacter daqiaonensis]SFR73799.1 diguanylate cyclase (GGDEF) domain-containing protein [Marinobacter daqiaonensis]
MAQAQKPERFVLSRLAWLGCLLLIALSLFSLLADQPVTALAALLTAGIVWTSPALPRHRLSRRWQLANQLLVLLLTIVLLSALWLGSEPLRYWLFALPLIILGLLPPRLAVPLLAIVLVAALITLATLQGDPQRHQIIAPLSLTALLGGLFFLLREYKTRQLAPLRRSDELTQAASREYLSSDLYKEIQRSEREGLDLSVIMIGLDAHLAEPYTDADIVALLPRIGRYLHSRLREFDTWYRVADLQFLIILPGIATADASKRAEQIRLGLMALLESHDLDVTVSAGVAGLNIGDDADTLRHSVASALQSAQKKGGNRVQTWSTWSHTPPAEPRGMAT